MFMLHSKLSGAFIILLVCVVNASNFEERKVSRLFQKPRIKSVLFGETFLKSERCWTRMEIAKLNARLQLEHLLPPRMPQNVPLIYRYIRLCLETAKVQVKDENVKTAILKVMADMFGGYQQAYGLPLMKRVNYEGNIRYKTVENSLRIQEEFKNYLNTNGLRWPAPIDVKNSVTTVKELNLSYHGGDKPCTDIFLVDPRESISNEPNNTIIGQSLPIPMPIIDDKIHPNAVAIPIKGRSFCSLTTENGFNILVDYYIRSIHCLKWMSNEWFEDKDDSLVTDFDVSFRNWIMKNVVPHLYTADEWYPGFSGVYRILLTMQSKGILNNFEMDSNLQPNPPNLENKVAEKTQRKMLILQNKHPKKIDPPEISEELINQVNMVTYFSTALLLMFFLIPILIVGHRNLTRIKNYCARFSKQNYGPCLQIMGTNIKNENSTVSPTSIESETSEETQYTVEAKGLFE